MKKDKNISKKTNKPLSLKKVQFARFGTYWFNLLSRTAMPIGITAWQFGVFKEDVSLFSRLQGGLIVSVIIGFAIVRKEIVAGLKRVENEGWYNSVRTTSIWLLFFLGLWWAHSFITEMLWVVGAFTVGSAQSIITEPIHQRNLQLAKEIKGIDEKDNEKAQEKLDKIMDQV